jgi:lipopolysaccharide/colanic/teichoic acid biosynthesis glycosyltransferase
LEGETFEMLKLRTMVRDADARAGEVQAVNVYGDTRLFKSAGDPRVTSIGRFLRRSSLDELPQLWNVLRGEMSLVGPRPPLPREVAQYKVRHYVRFEVAPGMTGAVAGERPERHQGLRARRRLGAALHRRLDGVA